MHLVGFIVRMGLLLSLTEQTDVEFEDIFKKIQDSNISSLYSHLLFPR